MQILQKQGFPIQPEEEDLKVKIQQLEKELNSPTHYRGRLNELMSHVRLHKATVEKRGDVKYYIDPNAVEWVKQFFCHQQESMSHLVGTIKKCKELVERMEEENEELSEKRVAS